MAPSPAHVLSDKLLAEGERTLAFFGDLDDQAWSRPLYAHDNFWTVRDALEHLTMAETNLMTIIAEVAAGGPGAPEGFDVDAFNREHTRHLAALDRPALLTAYRAQRARTAELARGLTESQLALRGRHPAMGDSSVADMLKMIYLHNAMHVKDIKRLA
jgi:Mycothiol maleylpyruvate isomerase N-terminal domain